MFGRVAFGGFGTVARRFGRADRYRLKHSFYPADQVKRFAGVQAIGVFSFNEKGKCQIIAKVVYEIHIFGVSSKQFRSAGESGPSAAEKNRCSEPISI